MEDKAQLDTMLGDDTSAAKHRGEAYGGAVTAVVGGVAVKGVTKAVRKGVKNLGNGKVEVTLENGKTAEIPESVAYDNKGIYDSDAVRTYYEETYGAQNIAKHSIDETTGRNVIETTAGQKGGWNTTLNKDLDPNTDYKVGNTIYKTDSKGRVEEQTFEVQVNKSDRNKYQQTKAGKTDGIKDGQSNDQGGHMQSAAHGGAGEQINYQPQNSNLNNGDWKAMENSWTKAKNEGQKIEDGCAKIGGCTNQQYDEFLKKILSGE